MDLMCIHPWVSSVVNSSGFKSIRVIFRYLSSSTTIYKKNELSVLSSRKSHWFGIRICTYQSLKVLCEVDEHFFLPKVVRKDENAVVLVLLHDVLQA